MSTKPLQLLPAPEPNPRIVRMLEEMLDLAKSGRLEGFGFVALLTSSEVTYAYRGKRAPYIIAGVLDHLRQQVLETVEVCGSEVVFEDEPGGREAPGKGKEDV